MKATQFKAGQPAHNELPWELKSYNSKHRWVSKNFQDPGACEGCGATGKLQWASLTGRWSGDHNNYTQRREDWARLCHRCHAHRDGNMPPWIPKAGE